MFYDVYWKSSQPSVKNLVLPFSCQKNNLFSFFSYYNKNTCWFNQGHNKYHIFGHFLVDLKCSSIRQYWYVWASGMSGISSLFRQLKLKKLIKLKVLDQMVHEAIAYDILHVLIYNSRTACSTEIGCHFRFPGTKCFSSLLLPLKTLLIVLSSGSRCSSPCLIVTWALI